jgi:hypothetical protein
MESNNWNAMLAAEERAYAQLKANQARNNALEEAEEQAQQEYEERWDNALDDFINSPNPETLATLQALQPYKDPNDPYAYIMYEVFPNIVDNNWADVVKFMFQFLDLDPVELKRPDVDINTNNHGNTGGVPIMESLHPSDGSYDTLKVFVEQALRKKHTWKELEDIYGYIEFFDEIKQEYIEDERRKLMYLRKATPSLSNNLIFGPIQSYMTETPVFNKEHEMRARQTDPFAHPTPVRTNRVNNTTRRRNRNNNGNRWAPSILQPGGPAKRIRKKKHTHRKKKRPLFRK